MIQRPDGTKPSSGNGVSQGKALPADTGGRKIAPPLPAVFLLLILGGGFLSAQETALPAAPAPGVWRLSPDEAVDLAIKNNLSLESARIALDTKKRKSDLVWNQFLPDLEVRGTLARDNKEADPVSVTVPLPGGTPISIPGAGSGRIPPGFIVTDPVSVPQWHAVGDFSATLALTSALFAGIKTIRQDYRTGLVTFEKAKVQLERDVRKAYYQMLLLEENIALLRESFSAANRRVIMARTNYEAGLVPELTWLQARVSMENMRPQIDQAESSHKLALANFAMTLGLPYDTLFELEPLKETIDFIDLDITELISKAASGKLDILELQQNILYYKSARMAQALQLWTPNLIFAWNYSPAFIQDPWKDDWSDEDNWKKSGTFSITLQWKLNNLFPFTKEGQGLKDTDNQIKTANMGLAQMIRGTEIEIYNTVLSLEKTRTTAEAQRLTVEMAEQSYRLTEEAYNAGLNELLEVQNAELELRKARIGVLEQNFNYLTGLIDLEYATGVPFGTLSKNTASDTQK